MVEAVMLKSRRFRQEREADWKRLEELLARFESGNAGQLTDADVLAIPVLYRAALSSLSLARGISLDQSLVAYLESLCTRAYFCVYGTRTTLVERIAGFFLEDWRDAVRAVWRETIVSTALTLLGAVVAFVLTRAGSEWFFSFVPQDLADGRTPQASAKDLGDVLFKTHDVDGLTVFSAFLFTHNAQIAILAFALGFAACLPTAFLMLYNGLMLGAFFAIYADHGLGVDFGGWALIHGTTELYAVILAGAAGFKLGWTLAFPGEKTRLDAMTEAGRQAATVMAGVVVMLAFAGLLEGFARQLITATWLRYTIAGTTGAMWLAYFYAPVRLGPAGATHVRR